jgi:hypothetical protein
LTLTSKRCSFKQKYRKQTSKLTLTNYVNIGSIEPNTVEVRYIFISVYSKYPNSVRFVVLIGS